MEKKVLNPNRQIHPPPLPWAPMKPSSVGLWFACTSHEIRRQFMQMYVYHYNIVLNKYIVTLWMVENPAVCCSIDVGSFCYDFNIQFSLYTLYCKCLKKCHYL